MDLFALTVMNIFSGTDPVNFVDADGRLSAKAWNAAPPRVQGGIKIVGGGMAMLGGAALIVTPEPTTLTKIAGSTAIGVGADFAVAGWQQMASGQSPRTLTAQSWIWCLSLC